MTTACPEALAQAIEQFNQHQFYRCHDTLEALWSEAGEPQRTFYQGLLQVAVALHHLENNNWRGAVILLGEGVRRLRRYHPDYETIDVATLLSQCLTLQQFLQAGLGAQAVEESNPKTFPSRGDMPSLPAIVQLPLSPATT